MRTRSTSDRSSRFPQLRPSPRSSYIQLGTADSERALPPYLLPTNPPNSSHDSMNSRTLPKLHRYPESVPRLATVSQERTTNPIRSLVHSLHRGITNRRTPCLYLLSRGRLTAKTNFLRISDQTRTKDWSRTRTILGSLARAVCLRLPIERLMRKSTCTILCDPCKLIGPSFWIYLMYSTFIYACSSQLTRVSVARSRTQVPGSTVRIPRKESHVPPRGLLLRQP